MLFIALQAGISSKTVRQSNLLFAPFTARVDRTSPSASTLRTDNQPQYYINNLRFIPPPLRVILSSIILSISKLYVEEKMETTGDSDR